MTKRYNVTIPRQYRTGNGEQKTHFWSVGTAFPLHNRDGISIKLYSKMLVTDQFVLFAEDEDQPEEPPPTDDGIPF